MKAIMHFLRDCEPWSQNEAEISRVSFGMSNDLYFYAIFCAIDGLQVAAQVWT